ncbi:cytochrome c biogenesis protein [Vigna unguiculata]|uniref:Cytochrome c biogenesis protein n=2 Tax=Vigna unguiculata TaxID=3917 RepID=A0A4D6LIL2_VIGUN|nr:cytochrome c biogenesis protein [Vigna unguiculata]
MKALSAINSTNPCLPNTHFLKVPIFHPFFKFNPFSQPYNVHGHAANRAHKLPFTISCKLKSSRDVENKGKSVAQKIVLSEASPPPLTEDDVTNGDTGNVPQSSKKKKGGPFGLLNMLRRKTLQILSSLPLAIADMFAAAALMALGTFIEQGEAPDFYIQKYPEDNPVFGFFTWRWILALGFDHMFSSPVFLGVLALLGASLMACTYTTQLPLITVSRRWSFLHSAEAIRKQEFSESLPRASIQDVGTILMGAGYEVFLKGPSLYAFKGLAGRLAPVGVHIALLLVMAGGTVSAAGSFRGSVTVPQGLNFVVGDVLVPSGFLSSPTEAFNTEIHVNRFYMDYYESGEVSQFYTDLSLRNMDGKEVMRKTISVNDPLRYGGITIYQTDWSISALQILKDNEGPYNLAMAPLQINGDKKLYGTFLPVGDINSPDVKGISMLARDLQSIVLYDKEGKFVGVRRPNSKLPINIDGSEILIVDAIGSSGLDLKTDPGVPVVYAGFGALMITTCISYLSHSQIWALQDGTTVFIGGKTNRAKMEFPEEMNLLLDKVPEIVESTLPKQADSISG